ncbi:T9SS type A sorting domain-containing protein [bacterium]|nr:T9SS type A sorting domain-containing protein [bacterium]
MKIRYFFFWLLFLVVFCGTVYAQTIKVSGHVFLYNQSRNDSVRVVFERVAPTSLFDSTYTDTSGYYELNIQKGVYTVTWSKEGYYWRSEKGLALYGDKDLTCYTVTRKEVPAMFLSIPSAMDAASPGDTVLVAPGTYYGTIDFKGKNITLASWYITTGDTSYISQTVLHGNKQGTVVVFQSNEDTTAVLDGFTVTNGIESRQASVEKCTGIRCNGASPRLQNLVITGNSDYSSAGVYLYYSNTVIHNVSIHDNYAYSYNGGGMYIYSGNPVIDNVSIYNNYANWYGGGIYIESSNPVITNVTFNNNDCYWFYGSGICIYNGKPVITNCILSNHRGSYAIYLDNSSPFITYTNFWNNQNNNFSRLGEWYGVNVTVNANGDSCDAYMNIQTDPCFIDPGNGDLRLRDNSRCIGAGTAENAPSADILGLRRGTPPDIGAYENPLNTPAPPVVMVSTELPDAVAGLVYNDTLRVDFPYGRSKLTYRLLEGPGWMTVDTAGILTGKPAAGDTGSRSAVTVVVSDPSGFADTLSTYLRVIDTIGPPSNVIVEYKSGDGNRCTLWWKKSSSEELGYVRKYLIYRSQTSVLTEPVPSTDYASPEALFAAEMYYTVLVDSVAPGVSRYTDDLDLRKNSQYYYWVQAVGSGMESDMVVAGVKTLVESVPAAFSVSEAYPNPFNPATTIDYCLPRDSRVTVTVYNISGARIAVLKDDFELAGGYSVVWNARGMPSGLYFCRFRADKFTVTKKLLLLK